MRRAAVFLLTPLVRAVEWLFGPRAPGLDLWLLCFATGWCNLMLWRPQIFDRPPLVGVAWLPDVIWIGLFCAMAVLHVTGLIVPSRVGLRQFACLFSAWVWITVSVSIATIEITTGVVTYAIVGMSALAGSLYLSGQPRREG